MKVLLVVYDNDSYIHWFPQGLAYIAAALRNAGHEIEIYNQDVHHYPESHLTEHLNSNNYGMIGIGIIAGYYQYRKLLKLSKAINASANRPNLFVIGGHGPSPEPEYFLKKTGADVVVIGEGEDTIVELLSGVDFSRVKGIAYKLGKEVKINSRRTLIKIIDKIALPAYGLFPMEHYRLLRRPHNTSADFTIPMLSGRGCKFNCNFCQRLDKGFRPRLTKSVIEEMLLLKEQYQITHIAFSDELLMSSVVRMEEFCAELIDNKVNMKWDCNGRLNFATIDVLKLMKRAGCVFINYGIECMDDEVLRRMNKGLRVKQIISGVENTLSVGISPGLNIIYGHIGDTKETLQKDIDFLLKYDDHAQLRTIRPVTPYPGSPLYYYAIQQGYLKDVKDFYENKHINSDLLSVNFTNMNDEEVHKLLAYANKILVDKYFECKREQNDLLIENLYGKLDCNFRGFRQP